MNELTKFIQIIFVVETNKITKSDNAYITWLLKKSFSTYIDEDKSSDLFIYYEFVYMDGKPNYQKTSVRTDIKSYISTFPYGKTYVVYCVDIDTQGKDDKELIDKIYEYTKDNDYYLVASYKEIEDVLKVNVAGSKSERVKYFLKHYPKSNSIDEKSLVIPYENIRGNIGKTNFNLVIADIIKHAIKSKHQK